MEKVRVDIPGLDLVLGGGLPSVRRADDLLPSTTLLVRGPPGSGKSVFGTQLAGALGRELGCDVAYGCIEILPHELREQHAAFGRAGERVASQLAFSRRGAYANAARRLMRRGLRSRGRDPTTKTPR